MSDGKERLQKYLARAGVASRRAAETLIEEGRIQVNGQIVRELGTQIDPRVDEVQFDGERISADVRNVYLLVNKPTAMISAASDPEGRPVVTDLAPAEYGRLFPVGRLDWDSEGAILLTNDGELANLLTHPRHEVGKTYMAKVKGLVSDSDPRIDKVRAGVRLDDGTRTLPAQVIRDADTGKHTWFVVSIREGKNRQIRRMFEAVGLDVIRLRRIAYGPVALGDVPPAGFRRLSEEEIEELYEAAGAKRPRLSASRGRLPRTQRDAVARRAKAAKGPAPEPAVGSRGKGKGASKPRAGGDRKNAGSRSRANDERGGDAPKSRTGAGRSGAAPKARSSDTRGASTGGAGSARPGASRTGTKPGGSSAGRAGSKTTGTGTGRATSKPGSSGPGRAGAKPGSAGAGRTGSKPGGSSAGRTGSKPGGSSAGRTGSRTEGAGGARRGSSGGPKKGNRRS